jgi:tetratricopeptide (TPR) repeat protein
MKRFLSLQRSVIGALIVLSASFSWAGNDTIKSENSDAKALSAPVEIKGPIVPSEILNQARQIEPDFTFKSEEAVLLFALQKLVQDNEILLKEQQGAAERLRNLFSQKFRNDLESYTAGKISEIEKQYDLSMQALIKNYEEALKNHPEDAVYSTDAMYFLGLYYFELDEKEYFAKLAEYAAAKEQGREDVPYPEENFSRTINIYERLKEQYPDYRHIDNVYYLLGMALWYEGDFYAAVDIFQALIKNYPKSRFVEELWFRLGEYYFDMDDYDDAIEAYTRVAKNLKSVYYDKALYKIAWSHYQKDRFGLAIEYFIKVLSLSYKSTEAGAGSDLKAEVLRYIVKSFSEELVFRGEVPKKLSSSKSKEAQKEDAEIMGERVAKEIISYFDGKGAPIYYREILLETASQLLDESKIDGAILALKRVIKLDPKSKDNPRLESQIAEILQEAGRAEDARTANEELIKRYNSNSSWFKAMKDNLEAQRFAREAVRDALLGLAVYYHTTGKNLKEENHDQEASSYFKKAGALYARYLRDYPERDDTAKAIFYLAEAAFELERFKTALDAYKLIKEYPLPVPDDMRRDATYNIIFTFRHVLESEAKAQRFKEIDFDALTSKQRGLTEEPIPKIGLEYLAAIDEFLRIAPQDAQVPVLLFHAAAIYYVYGYTDQAFMRFINIVELYPSSTAGVVAARLILDDAVSKENWEKVIELAKKFKDENLGGQGKDFGRIEGTARFKAARAIFDRANELLEKNQLTEAKATFKESAQLFETLLKEDPSNPFADVMLFNLARAIMYSGKTTEALPVLHKLYTEYPKSEFAKSARFQEALALEKMLKFADAAKAYDGIIQADPKSEEAGNAMLNKALLYEAAGDLSNAIMAYSAFAQKYPHREEAPEALLATARIYKKQGKINQEVASLESFIRQYRKDTNKLPAVIEAHVQVADSYADLATGAKNPSQKKNFEREALKNYQAAVALYHPDMNSAFAAYFAAKAQLILEKPEQEAFTKLSINARLGKAQSEQLTVMMKRLAELTQKNENIIKRYAQPVWNADALYRIGRLYEHLAKALVTAPCPRDVQAIDDFACDEYIVLLEDKAAVLEDKAVSAYEQSYEIALSAYDAPSKLIEDIQAGLNRMKPGKYQRPGNLLEKPKTGALYGNGRMLSSGRPAAGLHGDEKDPDRPKAEPKVEEVKEVPPAPENAEEKPADKEAEPAPAEEKVDEFNEDFE